MPHRLLPLLMVLMLTPAWAQPVPLKDKTSGPAVAPGGADPAAGAQVWRQCRACHAVEPGRHGVGPSLHGIVGAPVAAQSWGRPYSMPLQAMGASGATWTVEALSAFLENPRTYAPGTMMAYAGLRSPSDRLNLIAWLATQAD